MKIVRLLILDKEDVKERLAQLGADVPEGLTADQLGNLYSEWLEEMPADVDLVGVYVGGNQMNIVANDDAVWELPIATDSGRKAELSSDPGGLEAQVLALLEVGKKSEAIKLCREKTGCGLKDAEDAVEALAAKYCG